MNIVVGLIILVLGLLIAGALYEFISATRDRRRYSEPPGEMVSVNGHRLHLLQMGEATPDKPTVVLEAGVGGNVLDWLRLQPRIAEFAHVVSYDRAGYGWSDPGSDPRTPETIINELHTLLKNAGIQPPYVMVGHSFGGIYIRQYAETCPDEVAGLVLVDSSHPDMLAEQDTDDELRRLRNVGIFQRFGIVRLMLPRILSRANYYETEADRQKYLAFTLLDSYNSSREARPMFNDGANVSDHVDKPLLVISRDNEEDISAEAKWHEYQKKLVTLAPDTEHLIGEKGSHFVHLAEPELVARGVRMMIEKVTT
jgi:pimeloyl-ACP methyl ester carboxylesterase